MPSECRKTAGLPSWLSTVSEKREYIILIQFSVIILVLRFCCTLSVAELQCVKYSVLSTEKVMEETGALVRLTTKFR
jgi:hypothetical protein